MKPLRHKRNGGKRHLWMIGITFLISAFPRVTHAGWWTSIRNFYDFIYSLGNNPIDGLLALLGVAMQKIAAFFLWIVAGIFDSILQFTVVNLSQNIAGIGAITTTWGIIRDLINISFIFILLYIAIGTILNLSGVDWKGTLVKVVVAAVLINFSLFFTRTAIDVSNILALTFYNALTSNGAVTISEGFSNVLKISTLYGDITTAVNSKASAELILAGLGGTILILITTFVFLAATLLFIARFVTLIFLLILSPIGFFGSVLPGLGSAAQKWRSTLMDQLIFAPVFMILTWVTLQILSDPSFAAPAGATLNQAFATGANGLPPGSSTGGFMQMFMNYGIAITFMIATLVISKMAASRGSDLGQTIVGKVSGVGFGASAWAGRKSLGRVANFADKRGYLRNVDRIAGGPKLGEGIAGGFRSGGIKGALGGAARGLGTYAARGTASTVRGAQTGNLDLRQGMDYLGSKVGVRNLSGQVGIGSEFSDAGKGGYAALEKQKKEKRTAWEAKKTEVETLELIEAGVQAEKNPGYTAAKAAVLAGTANAVQHALVDTVDQMEVSLAQMSDKQIETLVSNNKKLLDSQEFANKISVRQLEAIEKSDKLNEQEKNGFRRARFSRAESIISSTPHAEAIGQIKSLTDKELDLVDEATISDTRFIEHLKQSQIESIQKSTKISSTTRQKLKNARSLVVESMLSANPAKIREIHAKEIAGIPAPAGSGTKLHPTILSAPVIAELNAKTISRLATDFSDEQARELDAAITATSNPAMRTWLDTKGKGVLT